MICNFWWIAEVWYKYYLRGSKWIDYDTFKHFLEEFAWRKRINHDFMLEKLCATGKPSPIKVHIRSIGYQRISLLNSKILHFHRYFHEMKIYSFKNFLYRHIQKMEQIWSETIDVAETGDQGRIHFMFFLQTILHITISMDEIWLCQLIQLLSRISPEILMSLIYHSIPGGLNIIVK